MTCGHANFDNLNGQLIVEIAKAQFFCPKSFTGFEFDKKLIQKMFKKAYKPMGRLRQSHTFLENNAGIVHFSESLRDVYEQILPILL